MIPSDAVKTATDRVAEAIEAEKIFADEMGATLDLSPAAKLALIRAYARGVDVRMVAVAIRPVTFRQASARSLR